MLTGETGSGKDYLARYIHDHSSRPNGPFFSINCAAIPEALAESELFGHEKGAFSGATERKLGLLELAEGGTLVLNEIGELSQRIQAKLLQFLDTKRFTRVGGRKEISVNARLIAATNRNLEQEVERGNFRRDLFYRINVIQIEVPPLRERHEDFGPLVDRLLDRIREEDRLTYKPFVDDASLAAMTCSPWKGNIRELYNTLVNAIVQHGGPRVKMGSSLPQLLIAESSETAETEQDTASPTWTWSVKFPPEKQLEDLAKDMKRAVIEQALRRSEGNKTKAARLLGISRDALNKQIKTLGIPSVRETHPHE
ncbi:MAG: sigma-54-dependent Fis family transcriptional regulator [Deltaproteobacteria bacterium]|nr:sigma-54-dependent Fis family transcriptional regulator [Deltaproteobacteria bacterium]